MFRVLVLMIGITSIQVTVVIVQKYQFYSLLQMRRSFRGTPKPEKEFIHTYHINEVPLPYYNPLEDPHLKPFFSNRKVNHHIERKGLRYQARKEYPYEERRTKNAYRHHRQNSPETPSSHILKDNRESRSMAKSLFLNRKIESSFFEGEEPVSPVLRRKAESEIFTQKPNKGLFLEEIMKKAHGPPRLNLSMSSASAQYRKKMVHSSDNRSQPRWMAKRNISTGRQDHILDPESPQ